MLMHYTCPTGVITSCSELSAVVRAWTMVPNSEWMLPHFLFSAALSRVKSIAPGSQWSAHLI